MGDNDHPKKDLTRVVQLTKEQTEQNARDSGSNPESSENDELKPIETVDDFQSLDQIGMMDHSAFDPITETWSTPPDEQNASSDHTSNSEQFFASAPAPVADQSFNFSSNPSTKMELTETTMHAAKDDPSSTAHATPDELTQVTEVTLVSETEASLKNTTPHDSLSEIREYSENSQGLSETLPVFYPFHLYLRGKFGPFERDKLLLFITENPIGLSSSDLDLQIQAGRVLFPRIGEYAGIRLIQDLRDSGLSFILKPSDRDQDEIVQNETPLNYRFTGTHSGATVHDINSAKIPILPFSAAALALYEEFDSIQGNQFLKAEMVEAEKSELFQEIVERLIDSVKQKAKLKGADALTHFTKTITPLRLPSQYQISVEATMLRKK